MMCLFLCLDGKRSAGFKFRLKRVWFRVVLLKSTCERTGVSSIGCSLSFRAVELDGHFLIFQKRFLQLMEYSVSRASWVLKNTRLFAVQQQKSCNL